MDDQLQAETASASPASWDADPYERHQLRYWDGAGWTEHVADHGTASVDPIEVASPWSMMTEPAAAPAPAPAVPEPVIAPQPVAPTPEPRPTPRAAPAPGGDWNALGPATMPVPAWSPPSQPAANFEPTGTEPASFGPTSAPRPRYRRRAGLLVLIAGAIVVLLLIGYLQFKPPDRIDAEPAAPTPAGFQVVTADEYQFAVPASWESRVLDQAAMDRLTEQVEARAPGAAEAFKDASENGAVDGTKTLAIDPATGDNINLIPYQALDGDPRDADNLAAIKGSFTAENTGLTPSALTVQPGDVHGFPAAVVRLTTVYGGQTLSMVSTIIQTGDRVFQLTVTSPSAPRAETLSAQIVPTFAPR